jgi:hypothetical protein
MKNLFKTLITVITVVCMLSSMTAFAASQTTITKYGSDTSVNVVTTVTGVAADVIVTYLVADDVDDDNVADANEIKYINQATANGTDDVEFSYAIKGEGWNAGKAIADVKFGSDNADVAGALNDDAVLFDDIEFVVTDEQGNAVEAAAELDKAYYIGKGDARNDVVISALPGYEIVSIKIGGETVDKSLSAHTVAYDQKVEVVVKQIKDTTVYLFTDATVTDGYEVYDQKSGDKLNVLTGIGYYVGGPVDNAAIVFDGIDIDGAHADYTYDAADVDKDAVSGYFAVQLAQKDAFAEDAKATCAHVTVGEDVVESK